MRHKKSGRQLNRNSSHRKAMMKNLTLSLFEFEKIKTSISKAKELRRVAEPLITLAKQDNLMRRRLAYSKIRSKKIVKKLYGVISKNPYKFLSRSQLNNNKTRAIADFISGMTDRYAINLYSSKK